MAGGLCFLLCQFGDPATISGLWNVYLTLQKSLKKQNLTTFTAKLYFLIQCLAHCQSTFSCLDGVFLNEVEQTVMNASKCPINSSISRKLKINHIIQFFEDEPQIADEPS